MRRESERVSAEVRVLFPEGSGITRDMSPSGVFILADEEFSVGQALRFSIEFDNPTGHGEVLYLDCAGEVVRVEDGGDERGIAVKIHESHLERCEAKREVRELVPVWRQEPMAGSVTRLL